MAAAKGNESLSLLSLRVHTDGHVNALLGCSCKGGSNLPAMAILETVYMQVTSLLLLTNTYL